MSRRRGLSADERRLWETVARTAVPLRAADAPAPEAPAEPSPLPGAAIAAAGPLPEAEAASLAMRRNPPPLSPIMRRDLSRVARGMLRIDGRIDLHGMSQHQAHLALRAYLTAAQARGARFVLVITGKGLRADASGDFIHATHLGMAERGVLRRHVPQWLAEPGLRDIVLGFEEAHRSHGGGGALYVRIRRRREPGTISGKP